MGEVPELSRGGQRGRQVAKHIVSEVILVIRAGLEAGRESVVQAGKNGILPVIPQTGRLRGNLQAVLVAAGKVE